MQRVPQRLATGSVSDYPGFLDYNPQGLQGPVVHTQVRPYMRALALLEIRKLACIFSKQLF